MFFCIVKDMSRSVAKGLPIVALFCVLAAFPLFADFREPPRSFPLPLAEAETVVSRWLTGAGLDVSRTDAGDGKVLFKASKKGESWEIELAPNSPLAFIMVAGCFRNGEPCPEGTAGLRTYLEGYERGVSVENPGRGQKAPAAVAERGGAIACIRGEGGRGTIQFSGFFVSRDGLILATAHDLEGVPEVTVILRDGERRAGRIVKLDRARDLSLIDTGSGVDASVSLSSGRGGLREGETVYSIGCPGNRPGTVHMGVVDGPRKLVNKLPLWQVDMETFPGGSGSPVFDRQGNLVGVVKGRYRGTDSRGFLIPVETVLEFLGEDRRGSP